MSIQNFRIVALAEATSWLLLVIVTALKYGADGPDLAPILGPIHGLLFLAYVLMVFALRSEAGWTMQQTLLILVGAVIPLGGYVVERKMLRGA